MLYKNRKTRETVEAIKFSYTSECLEQLVKMTYGFDGVLGEHGRYIEDRECPWMEILSSELQVKVVIHVGDFLVKYSNGNFEPFFSDDFVDTFKPAK